MIQQILTASAEAIALSGLALIFVSAIFTFSQGAKQIKKDITFSLNKAEEDSLDFSPETESQEFTQLPFLNADEIAERFGVKAETVIAHANEYRNGRAFGYSFETWATNYDGRYHWRFLWSAEDELLFYPISSDLFTKHLLAYCNKQ